MSVRHCLTIRRLSSGNIRVSRVSSGIERPHSIAIERIVRKSRIGITAGVRCHLRDLREVCAIVALTTLD